MERRQFIVPKKEAGERLDKWLVQRMSGLSRNKIKTLLNEGRILVNDRRVVIAGWELEPNDKVDVQLGEEEKREQRERFLPIIFEDKDILVVDKPAGVLVEPKENSPHEHLLGMVKSYLRRKYKENSYVALVHRLDKETSGVMVVAKSKTGEQLEDQFRRHRVERHYTAVVEGKIGSARGKIELPLEKGEFGGGKKVRVVSKKEGRLAVTFYEVIERYSKATLLRIRVDTGRTHQIRVHLAHEGHPILGDSVYGTFSSSFRRQALHASYLSFSHPRTGKRIRFESRLPKDIATLIDSLRG